MSTIYDLITLRRPPLNYVCPPICEVLFSASGFPIIVLDPFTRRQVTGLVLGGTGGQNLSWNAYPGALCYTIYKALDSNDPFGPYEIVFECIDGGGCEPQPCMPLDPGCYRVSAITLDGESELSDPMCIAPLPDVVTLDDEGVTNNEATLNGEARANGLATTAWFEWGLTEAYGNTTMAQAIGDGTTFIPISEGLTGLISNTTYHFRAVAQNANGTRFGVDESFHTLGGGDIPIQWSLLYGAGFAGLCDATADEISVLGRLTLQLNASTNGQDVSTFCPADCHTASNQVLFDCTNVIGPFAEDRILTLSGPVHLENTSYTSVVFDFENLVCEPPVTITSNSVFTFEFHDSVDGLVDSVVENCMAPATPRDFVVNRSYTLPAGRTFFVLGQLISRSVGTTCNIDIGLTSVPA